MFVLRLFDCEAESSTDPRSSYHSSKGDEEEVTAFGSTGLSTIASQAIF